MVRSEILSSSFPYFVLPAPITQTFSTNVDDKNPYKNYSIDLIKENNLVSIWFSKKFPLKLFKQKLKV